MLCLAAVVVWAGSGPFFEFSETWQLVINTGTTIIRFLMVFVIQNTQNGDGAAVQTKLDEIKELEALHLRCEKSAKRSQAILQRTHAERTTRKSKSNDGAQPRADSP
nr:low affinity iron permease family protein [Rhizobium leguminosarum]